MTQSISNILKNKNTKAGGYYLVGNLFNKAIGFLTIPIFTRIMTTSDYGIVNTYLSWVSILSLIVGLSLGNSIRSAYIDFRENLEEYISSILFLALINFFVSSGLILLIAYFFIKEVDTVLVLLCLIQSFMSFINNTMTIKYMMEMDYVKKTLLLALPNISISILSVIFLLNMNTNKYFGRIIPHVIVTSIIGIYYILKYFIKTKKLVNIEYWKYAITVSWPLIFHGLSLNILSSSDRTMLTIFCNASETGIYSLIYNFSMIATVVMSSLESVWIPWFTNNLKNNNKHSINKNVKIYIEIIMIVMIAIIMVGPEILVIMAPKEYWSGNILIPPVVLASFFIFLYSISVNLEYYYKSTKIIATNTVIAALINLGLNFIFIPMYGSIAAAFTTVVAYITSFIIHYNAARRLDNELFPFKIYVLPILIMLSSVILSYLVMDYMVLRWGIVIVGLCSYVYISIKSNRFKVIFKNG